MFPGLPNPLEKVIRQRKEIVELAAQNKRDFEELAWVVKLLSKKKID